jgi:hypothetical protein
LPHERHDLEANLIENLRTVLPIVGVLAVRVGALVKVESGLVGEEVEDRDGHVREVGE